MGLERSYNLLCDGCSKTRIDTRDTPRHARAAAKRDGWARVNMGRWWVAADGERYQWNWFQDLCPDCLDKLVQEVM